MELDDEYESLPITSPPIAHMMAGACAGVLEHTIMYPIDCVKTRLQSLRPVREANYSGVIDGLRRIIRYEGFGRTIRGIGVVVGGAGPAHALYFSCYEHTKSVVGSVIGQSQLSYGIAGVFATLLHDFVMTPTDAIKQRVQMYNSPYTSSFNCIRSVLQREGVGVLYRAYFTQLSMNIPHQCVHFMVYEAGQDAFNKDRQYLPVTHMACGAVAGGTAAALTTPFDVCKTLLNTQERCALDAIQSRNKQVRGIRNAVVTIYRLNGLSGFFKGLTARVVFQMPGTAISWSVYELFKFIILSNKFPDAESGKASVAASSTSSTSW